jgi:hypothetical protein
MLIHLSEIHGMGTWHVIEEALVHMRPRRTPLWLSEQLGVTIQVVSNWKARGVPASRFREIAKTLGLSVDQLEGVVPLPWEENTEASGTNNLLPEVASAANAINQLPKKQRDWVLEVVQSTIKAAVETLPLRENDVTQTVTTAPKRRSNG